MGLGCHVASPSTLTIAKYVEDVPMRVLTLGLEWSDADNMWNVLFTDMGGAVVASFHCERTALLHEIRKRLAEKLGDSCFEIDVPDGKILDDSCDYAPIWTYEGHCG